MKNVLLNSGASGEDTENVFRRPKTKVDTDYGWATPYV